MSSTYHGNLTISIFGQSHAPAIGVTIDGLPAGERIDMDELGRFLARRAPGHKCPQPVHINGFADRKSVNGHTDGRRVGLAEDGDFQICSEDG